jgi:hypothetical protein
VFRDLLPRDFAAFAEPGYVKIAFTLRADPIDEVTSIFRTETRAMATDMDARARFRKYWAIVSPGVTLIRRAMLVPIKANAERQFRAGRRVRHARRQLTRGTAHRCRRAPPRAAGALPAAPADAAFGSGAAACRVGGAARLAASRWTWQPSYDARDLSSAIIVRTLPASGYSGTDESSRSHAAIAPFGSFRASRFTIPTLNSVCPCFGIDRQRLVELCQRLVGASRVIQRRRQVGAHAHVLRIERERLLVVRDRFRVAARVVQPVPELDVGAHVLRIRLKDVPIGLKLLFVRDLRRRRGRGAGRHGTGCACCRGTPSM